MKYFRKPRKQKIPKRRPDRSRRTGNRASGSQRTGKNLPAGSSSNDGTTRIDRFGILIQDTFSDREKLLRIIIALIITFFLITFLFFLFSRNSEADIAGDNVEKNIKSVERFDYSNVSTVEQEIDELNAQNKTESSTTTDKAAYQKAFKGSIILGDSVTEGISAYGYLSEDVVFSKIGASVASDSDLFKKAAALYPRQAFFAMGMNDMGNYDDPKEFVKQYKKCLKQFMKDSPKSEIYVCSISKPSDSAIARKSWLGNSEKFNKQIKAMCKSMDITYIDVTSIFKNHPELYEKDGIHAKSAYYPYWLEMMADAADIKIES